ncbi:unnamed protein product [Symbiodinium necroappetens]|uniref:Uncharacterized protein n=1 Tax=Symbiodinium necroappetens TaxID=1628268 RepID=A0A813B5C0_9DINO|nr:unnamed protein product [Symbiodinium necroappetens]
MPCLPRSAKLVGWQARAGTASVCSVSVPRSCCCWLEGVAARHLERHLDQELRGELVLLYGAEARATDMGFYLLHLVQLPLLRTGRYALVAALIVAFLAPPLDITPPPVFDPIRLPPTQATRALLPPVNPLPHELLDLWAEVRAARFAKAALRSRLVELWRRTASLQNRAGALMRALGCLGN